MIFNVAVKEELKRYVSCEANTEEEAVEMVKGLYDDGSIVLDADDFTSVDFEIEGTYVEENI